MEIIKIKSIHPKTDYAPNWNISLGKTVWDDIDSINIIKTWLLDNEERILKQFPIVSDGGTALGPESVTSRSGGYNLFKFANELPELNNLLQFLRISYLDFVSKDITSLYDLEVVSWFNIVKDGQKIREHSHAHEPLAYLSGNMHLGNYNTFTYYRSPYTPLEFIPIPNVTGGLTLFPSYVPHKTDEYKQDIAPRLSIAFDLRLSETWPIGTPDDKKMHAIPFMNKQILKQFTQHY
jgi:hypothetical protein